MTTLAIIPARANSERCPGKNIAMLGTRELIRWTIDAALGALFHAYIDEVVISTDDKSIAEIKPDDVDLLIRPAELATAEAPMIKVVKYVVEQYQEQFDNILLLQPTSPFRTTDDICRALDLHQTMGGDAVISVTDTPPDFVFELGHAGRIRPVTKGLVANGAIFIITASHLKAAGTWFNGVTYGYYMPKNRSLDIDTKLDLEIARMMVANGEYNA